MDTLRKRVTTEFLIVDGLVVLLMHWRGYLALTTATDKPLLDLEQALLAKLYTLIYNP